MESYQRLDEWVGPFLSCLSYTTDTTHDNFIAADQLISLILCHLYKAYRLDLLSVDGRKRVSCTIIITIFLCLSVIFHLSYKYRSNDKVCSAYLYGFDLCVDEVNRWYALHDFHVAEPTAEMSRLQVIEIRMTLYI